MTFAMENLSARTEIHEAWSTVYFAEEMIRQGNLSEAKEAIAEAERRYTTAVALTENPASMQDRLFDLRTKLDLIRSAVRTQGS